MFWASTSILLLLLGSTSTHNLHDDSDQFDAFCSLRPMDFGLYNGVFKVDFQEASNCCHAKGLSLLTLPHPNIVRNLSNFTKWHVAHQTLLSYPFKSLPIGRTYSLFVNVSEDNTLSSVDNSSNLCDVLYFKSPRNMTLIFDQVECDSMRGYICESGPEAYRKSVCPKMTSLLEDKYFFTRENLPWSEAMDCCHQKGASLVRTDSSQTSDILSGLLHHSLIRRKSNSTFAFWTEGSRQSSTSDFTWLNNRKLMVTNDDDNRRRQYCVAGVASSGKILTLQARCERRLPFVCRTHPEPKCSSVEFVKLHTLGSMRTYWHSGASRMRWKDAAKCCLQRGYKLFSVISPREGGIIAGSLRLSLELQQMPLGVTKGLWTSHRRTKELLYASPYVLAELSWNMSGINATTPNPVVNHFIQGVERGGGVSSNNCLQFVADIRNSYFLNNIPCESRRAFICDETIITDPAGGAKLKELGNQYYTSDRAVDFQIAQDLCGFSNMELLEIRDPEETIAIRSLLKNLYRKGKKKFTLWTKALPPPPKPLRLPMTLTEDHSVDTVPIKGPSAQYAVIKETLRKRRKEFLKQQETVPPPLTLQTVFCDALNFERNTSKLLLVKEDCSKPHHVICEAGGVVRKYSSPTETKCSVDFLQIASGYLLSQTKSSWREARKCCASRDRELASITSEELLHLHANDIGVPSSFPGPTMGYWTSGTNLILGRLFVWAESYEFFRLNNVFLNNYTTTLEPLQEAGLCLEAYGHPTLPNRLGISDDYCVRQKRFLCAPRSYKYRVQDCNDIEFNSILRTGYFISVTGVPWLRAIECCKERGSTIAVILTKEINQLLYKGLIKEFEWAYEKPVTGFWIGLTNGWFNASEFLWAPSMIKLNYSNWNNSGPQLPMHDSDLCVAAYTERGKVGLTWQKVNCKERRPFICRKIGGKA